jgi:hypothetical protein
MLTCRYIVSLADVIVLKGCATNVCSRMLTYAHVCSRMLTCRYVVSLADVIVLGGCTTDSVCSRMLTYADMQVCRVACGCDCVGRLRCCGGTLLPCFTSTKVQVLTPEELRVRQLSALPQHDPLCTLPTRCRLLLAALMRR